MPKLRDAPRPHRLPDGRGRAVGHLRQDDGLLRELDRAHSRHADLRGSDRGRGHRRRHDRDAADRRYHHRQLHLPGGRPARQSGVEDPVHVRGAGEGAAGLPFRLYYGGGNAAQHSDRNYPMFMQVPGLTIAMPASPRDAKGLLKTAIRNDEVVLFFEDGNITGREEIPDDELIPFGKARVRRDGDDVTIVALGGSVPQALRAAERLEEKGISAEVIDPGPWCRSTGRHHRLRREDRAPDAGRAGTRTCGACARSPPSSVSGRSTRCRRRSDE